MPQPRPLRARATPGVTGLLMRQRWQAAIRKLRPRHPPGRNGGAGVMRRTLIALPWTRKSIADSFAPLWGWQTPALLRQAMGSYCSYKRTPGERRPAPRSRPPAALRTAPSGFHGSGAGTCAELTASSLTAPGSPPSKRRPGRPSFMQPLPIGLLASVLLQRTSRLRCPWAAKTTGRAESVLATRSPDFSWMRRTTRSRSSLPGRRHRHDRA